MFSDIVRGMKVRSLRPGANADFDASGWGLKGRMPSGSFFFDAIERQEPYDEDNPDPRDNTAGYSELSDEALKKIAGNVKMARVIGRATMFVFYRNSKERA